MHLPFVPYRGFIRLAGPALAAEVDRMLARPGLIGLVLMADPVGGSLELVTVGQDQEHARFEDLAGRQIGAMRPCCGLRVEDVRQAEARSKREAQLAAREAAVTDREREVERMEQRLAEIVRTLAENNIQTDVAAPKSSPGRKA